MSDIRPWRATPGFLRTSVPLSVTNWPFFKIIGHWFRYLLKNQRFSNDFGKITDHMSVQVFRTVVFKEIADCMSDIRPWRAAPGFLRTSVPLSVTNWPFFKIIGHWFRYLLKNQRFSNDFGKITDHMSVQVFRTAVFKEIADCMSDIRPWRATPGFLRTSVPLSVKKLYSVTF
ncbi:hypothetical protein SAMN05877753_101119 [Bacillus oleivorans]|uniref:Uncharacterized protein n=1 Tax=Bacillus oleivorans TaxID=1448271 RepID=A0A285CGS9_9BACI|nr:hypothetical protein [Bacillus oleivorans]SNX66807.1 hypothetical protein SAMN05877753_101119 [Bacillus oleivorans]